MHTIFYGINFSELNGNSASGEPIPEEKDLILCVTINDSVIYNAVQGGRLLKKDGVSIPDSGYRFILNDNYILRKDGNFFELVGDLEDDEISTGIEIRGLGFSSKSEQERQEIRIRFEEILENKYRKVEPDNALNSLYTKPFDVEKDVLLIRDRSASSDTAHRSPGKTDNLEGMVIELPIASNTLDFPIYPS